MVSCFSSCGRFFRMFDFFQSSKFLRYNGDAEYKSTTGGFTSVAVVIIFAILFSSMGLRTIKKEIISSSVDTQSSIEPSELTVNLGPGGDTMFAVTVYGLNLSSIPKLFDVEVFMRTYQNGVYVNKTAVPMEQCTAEHFNFGSDLASALDRLAFSSMVCPQIGQAYSIQGKPSSAVANFLSVAIRRCDPATDIFCANDTIYNMAELGVGRFVMAIPFVNVQVNPGSQEYRKYYVEDQNIFYFNSQLGTLAFAKISEDVIKTDLSLMPYEQIQEEKVVRIADQFTTSHFMANSTEPFVQVLFAKSPETTTYERSFNKVDAYFSYVGGLVGTIIGLLFIMEFYTEKAFEVSIARKVMLDNNQEEISSSSFNLFYYFSMMLKGLFSKCKYEPDWPRTNFYDECCEEMAMQLDVTYIIRKLMFFDAALNKLLKKEELEELYLRRKQTLKEAKEQRRKYYALEIFRILEGRGQEGEEAEGQAKGEQDLYKTKEYTLNDGMVRIPVKFKHRESEDMSAMEISRASMDFQHFENALKTTNGFKRGGHQDRCKETQRQLVQRGKNERQPSIVINQVAVKDEEGKIESRKVKFDKGFSISSIKD